MMISLQILPSTYQQAIVDVLSTTFQALIRPGSNATLAGGWRQQLSAPLHDRQGG